MPQTKMDGTDLQVEYVSCMRIRKRTYVKSSVFAHIAEAQEKQGHVRRLFQHVTHEADHPSANGVQGTPGSVPGPAKSKQKVTTCVPMTYSDRFQVSYHKRELSDVGN